ncbi:hypothetical protein BTVI_13710 [Pitangus sulphuratus]|nr:hypothetical protein BTVI_13710 [Pitangus sulphuratus]
MEGSIVTKDEDKAETPSLPQFSTRRQVVLRTAGFLGNNRELKSPLVIQNEEVSDLLSHLDPHKSMGSDGIHPRIMRELKEEITKLLSIIYQQSWLSGVVPGDWKLANVMPIYKKGQKEDHGNYRPVSLTSGPGKVILLVDEGKAVDVSVWTSAKPLTPSPSAYSWKSCSPQLGQGHSVAGELGSEIGGE